MILYNINKLVEYRLLPFNIVASLNPMNLVNFHFRAADFICRDSYGTVLKKVSMELKNKTSDTNYVLAE